MKKKSETKVPKTVAELVTDLNESATEEAEKESGIVEDVSDLLVVMPTNDLQSEEGKSDTGDVEYTILEKDPLDELHSAVVANRALITQLLDNEVVVGKQLDTLNNFMAVMSKYIPQQPDKQPLRMKTYTVMPQDTMAKIAKKLFGNPGYAGRIVGLNNDQITRAEDIVPGMVLKLPVI